MNTLDVAAQRPRFTLSKLDWLLLVAAAGLGGFGYNAALAADRGELAAATAGTALAIAAVAWGVGRLQWASGGRVAGGGRVSFRIALVLLAGFGWIKGVERLEAQVQARAATAQVGESVAGLRRVLDAREPVALPDAFGAEVAAQRARAAATGRMERTVRVVVIDAVAEALAPQVDTATAMQALLDAVPLRTDTLSDADARAATLARARALVARGSAAVGALRALPDRADAGLARNGVAAATREQLRQWLASHVTTDRLEAWVAYGNAVVAFYEGLERIDGRWSVSPTGQLVVEPDQVAALQRWVAEHERAAAAIGIGG